MIAKIPLLITGLAGLAFATTELVAWKSTVNLDPECPTKVFDQYLRTACANLKDETTRFELQKAQGLTDESWLALALASRDVSLQAFRYKCVYGMAAWSDAEPEIRKLYEQCSQSMGARPETPGMAGACFEMMSLHTQRLTLNIPFGKPLGKFMGEPIGKHVGEPIGEPSGERLAGR
jgi:hypothetical protein